MSVEDGIQAVRSLVGQIKRLEGLIPSFRWGQVTSVNPFYVQFDDAGDPVPIPSQTAGASVGDRVLVAFWPRRAAIIGVAGGRDPNTVVVGGESYRRSGVISRSVATTTSSPPGYIGNTTLTMPFTPPAGWFFHVVYMNTQSNVGYTAWLGYVTGAATASVTCRIIGNISGTANGFFLWELRRLPT